MMSCNENSSSHRKTTVRHCPVCWLTVKCRWCRRRSHAAQQRWDTASRTRMSLAQQLIWRCGVPLHGRSPTPTLRQFLPHLHGMQMRSSDENSVCLSVRPSVSLSKANRRCTKYASLLTNLNELKQRLTINGVGQAWIMSSVRHLSVASLIAPDQWCVFCAPSLAIFPTCRYQLDSNLSNFEDTVEVG